MTEEAVNREDPGDWIKQQRSSKFEDFREEQVVGAHCERCQYDPNPIVKRGSLDADLMVVGSQVSTDDYQDEKPFTGPAGELLEDMLQAIELNWEQDCYLTNALLCKTTEETPKKRSVDACYVNLSTQIEIVSPNVLLALGKNACQSVLRLSSSESLKDFLGSQGTVPEYPWVDVVVTFNPAYILRNKERPEEFKKLKKIAWSHLKEVKRKLVDEDGDD